MSWRRLLNEPTRLFPFPRDEILIVSGCGVSVAHVWDAEVPERGSVNKCWWELEFWISLVWAFPQGVGALSNSSCTTLLSDLERCDEIPCKPSEPFNDFENDKEAFVNWLGCASFPFDGTWEEHDEMPGGDVAWGNVVSSLSCVCLVKMSDSENTGGSSAGSLLTHTWRGQLLETCVLNDEAVCWHKHVIVGGDSGDGADDSMRGDVDEGRNVGNPVSVSFFNGSCCWAHVRVIDAWMPASVPRLSNCQTAAKHSMHELVQEEMSKIQRAHGFVS